MFFITEACLRLPRISSTRWSPPPISNGHCPTDRITKMSGDMAVALTPRLTTVIDMAGQPWHYTNYWERDERDERTVPGALLRTKR